MAKVRELCSLIHLKYDTEADFSRALGWPRQRLSRITTGMKEPTLQETAQIARELDTDLPIIADIFLRHKSSNG